MFHTLLVRNFGGDASLTFCYATSTSLANEKKAMLAQAAQEEMQVKSDEPKKVVNCGRRRASG